MWTADNRPRYNREEPARRGATGVITSDLTDAEWAHIGQPLIPENPALRQARRRQTARSFPYSAIREVDQRLSK